MGCCCEKYIILNDDIVDLFEGSNDKFVDYDQFKLLKYKLNIGVNDEDDKGRLPLCGLQQHSFLLNWTEVYYRRNYNRDNRSSGYYNWYCNDRHITGDFSYNMGDEGDPKGAEGDDEYDKYYYYNLHYSLDGSRDESSIIFYDLHYENV